MTLIGVRDLKNRASEIVREVQTREAEYAIPLLRRAIAVIKPFHQEDEQKLRLAQREEALRALDALAEKIAQSWRGPESAVELIEEQRR